MTWLKQALLPITLLLAACQPKADPLAEPGEATQQTKVPASPFNNPVAIPESGEQVIDLALPEPGEVLRAIYKKAGDGSSAYDIGHQTWASYWYGHIYEIKGRQYFTGFAYNTAERRNEAEEGYAGPGDQVAIAQATYARAPEGSVATWEFVKAERDIGYFGGYEKANVVDRRLPIQTYDTPRGEYFIAIPTWHLESGIRLSVAEIFRLNPQQSQWSYMGSIQTGEDNSASCAEDSEDGLPPCAVSFGRLVFRQQPEEEVPSIKVAKKGKVVEGPNKTRDLGLADASEYSYDKTASHYRLIH